MAKARFTNKKDKKRNSKIIKGKKVKLPKEILKQKAQDK